MVSRRLVTGCRRSSEIQHLLQFSCVSIAVPMPAGGCSNGGSRRPRLVSGLTRGSREGSAEVHDREGCGAPRSGR
ncbi:hypothetical protein TIFTF001_017193 [Ficus carica]|uniref:Uncharacterized protein n=1 Tax=Ficus carica TaxID=3494 RepID=A0AA88DIZ7_FICCA|nr:hypothetical protein TIFTF001_017193 [Ficus carica]